MAEWFPAIQGMLEERGIRLPQPYPHTWRTLLGSTLAALIAWAVLCVGYTAYVVIDTTVQTVVTTAETVSQAVNSTLQTTFSSPPQSNATDPASAPVEQKTESASATPLAPVLSVDGGPIPAGGDVFREALQKSPLPFRENGDLSLTDAAKQTDFALLQTVLRLKLDRGRVYPLTSQYSTRGRDSWHLQRMRLYIPMPVEDFINALEESLDVWSERAVLTREGGGKLVLSVEGVRTHEIWLTPTGERFLLPPAGDGPRLTIVIDDLGENPQATETLLGLNIPVTFAIWPFAAHAAETARAAHQADREVLIHQPMQPMQSPFLKAGPGELTLSLSAEDIRKNINQSLAAVPYAVGMNNHMGSRITQDATADQRISETLAASGLFVLDSLTHPKSILYDVARQQGLPAYRRAVFLDDGPRTEQSVLAGLKKAETLARQNGQAIAIGHPHPETLAALKTWAATREPAIHVVPLRHLSVPVEMLKAE